MNLFEKEYAKCKAVIDGDTDKAKQYRKEIDILKNLIKEKEKISEMKPIYIILHSVMELSKYRIGYTSKMGWICGTYISSLKRRLRAFFECMFTPDELDGLVYSCAHKDVLSEHQYKMLVVFIHNTPKIIVHRKYTLD